MWFIWLLALFVVVKADDDEAFSLYTNYEAIAYGCHGQVALQLNYCADGGFDCICVTREAIASVMGCLYDKMNAETYEKAFNFNIEWCDDYFTNITAEQQVDGLQYYQESAISFADVLNYTVGGYVTRPVKFDEENNKLYIGSYWQFVILVENNGNYYAFAIIAYWILVLFLYAVNNWMKFLFSSVFVRSRESYLLSNLKRYVVIPASYGSNKLQAVGSERFGGFFKMLVPSRIETLVLIVFLGSCLAFLGVDMNYIKGNPVFDGKSDSMEYFISEKAGVMGTITIPLLILFSGRNNVLQWATGVNFATFIMYHKWMARMFVTMIIIHSLGYSINFGSYYVEDMADNYIIWGVIGTIACSLMVLQSLLYFRHNWYEVFLVIHILLAVLFIVGTWIHVVDLGYVWFMYIAISIWVFDRVVRIGRLFFFGSPLASVKLVNGDILKLEIPTRKFWRPLNGGFAFVYFLSASKFFQSHPYTYVQLPKQINFYIKVKQGITQKLQSELASLPDMTKSIRVTVEGPYGGGLESCNIKSYHRAVFLAGGNGIPGLYSEAMSLGVRREMKQQIKLIWVIRDYNALNWFWEELLELAKTKVEVDVYITRPETKLQEYISELEYETSKEKEKESETGSETEELDRQIKNVRNSFPHVNFSHGRPVLGQILASEVQASEGSVAVVACGHPIMVDEVRQEVARTNGEKRVDFYEHMQIWA